MINDFFPLRPTSRLVISRERSDREIFNPREEGFLAIARNDRVAAGQSVASG